MNFDTNLDSSLTESKRESEVEQKLKFNTGDDVGLAHLVQ